MENYGDAESPYMKFKGGSTYVMFNCGDLTENEIASITAQVRPYITTTMLETNGGSEEYIIGRAEMIDHNQPHAESWETTTQFNITPSGQVNFMKVTDNRDEDGWMKKEILEKTESWVGDMSDTKRGNYKAEFLMEDGDIVLEKDLREWFELNSPEPEVVLPDFDTYGEIK
tara:strand:- start:1462 stop:1974 length:513 start_codon:yes stop_codon:yes gene_type:complete